MSTRAHKLVMLADDDADDAEIFLMGLTKIDASIQLVHLTTGMEVIEYLKQPQSAKPDIIFLDINMPEMNGWQCLKSLKKDDDCRNIPVVMYTTSSHPRDKEIALGLGAYAFVTKPSDYRALENILRTFAAELYTDAGEAASPERT